MALKTGSSSITPVTIHLPKCSRVMNYVEEDADTHAKNLPLYLLNGSNNTFECPIPDCRHDRNFFSVKSHIMRSHNEYGFYEKDYDPELAMVPEALKNTAMRIDLALRLVVCHATHTVLLRSQLLLHSRSCSQCSKFDSTKSRQELQHYVSDKWSRIQDLKNWAMSASIVSAPYGSEITDLGSMKCKQCSTKLVANDLEDKRMLCCKFKSEKGLILHTPVPRNEWNLALLDELTVPVVLHPATNDQRQPAKQRSQPERLDSIERRIERKTVQVQAAVPVRSKLSELPPATPEPCGDIQVPDIGPYVQLCADELDKLSFGLQHRLVARWADGKLFDNETLEGGYSFATDYRNEFNSQLVPREEALLIEMALEAKVSGDEYLTWLITLLTTKVPNHTQRDQLMSLATDLEELTRKIFALVFFAQPNSMKTFEFSALTYMNPHFNVSRNVEIFKNRVSINNRKNRLPWVVSEILTRYLLIIRPLQVRISNLLGMKDRLSRCEEGCLWEVDYQEGQLAGAIIRKQSAWIAQSTTRNKNRNIPLHGMRWNALKLACADYNYDEKQWEHLLGIEQVSEQLHQTWCGNQTQCMLKR